MGVITMKQYDYVAKALKETGDYNCCAVVALTVASNQPAKKVQAMLDRLGRKRKQGTSVLTIDAAAVSLGLIQQDVTAHYPRS
jgi:hypothetical protein